MLAVHGRSFSLVPPHPQSLCHLFCVQLGRVRRAKERAAPSEPCDAEPIAQVVPLRARVADALHMQAAGVSAESDDQVVKEAERVFADERTKPPVDAAGDDASWLARFRANNFGIDDSLVGVEIVGVLCVAH